MAPNAKRQEGPARPGTKRAPMILQADLTWAEGRFQPDLAVTVAADGTIARVGPAEAGKPVERLAGRALIPGLVNGHSHAFQRAIRGRTEYRSPGAGRDDFWTWRERMYATALRLEPEDVQAISAMAFLEMALSGITTVGEFHYLHRDRDGAPYADPDELALRVLAAASEVGIHPVLLRVAYARAGFGRAAEPRQRRFVEADPAECVAAVERLAAAGHAVGVAPHSIRAVPRQALRELGDFARRRALPFHLHAAEQPREIEESLAEHGLRPLPLLEEEGLLDERLTVVHGIHLAEAEVRALGRVSATVCACPTTERNLGDGIVPADGLLAAGARISLGSDSHCQIDLLEDARELEYHLRLRTLSRAVLSSGSGDPSELAARLFACATEAGARSLGVAAGTIAPGRRADLVALRLDDPSIAGAEREDLMASVVFGLARTAVDSVWIGGRRVVREGSHEGHVAIHVAFRQALRRIR